MLATAMWDTMMCHVIMKNAEIRAFGVTTSVEVFNEILDTYCPLYEADPSTLSVSQSVHPPPACSRPPGTPLLVLPRLVIIHQCPLGKSRLW